MILIRPQRRERDLLEWDDLKYVLAIARHGSLGKAARALDTTQPTVGRRLEAFERRVGVKLFERASDGLKPTTLGEALLDSLGRMEESALAVERRIAARDTGLQGPITVTSIDWLGDHLIAPLAAEFVIQHPLVNIELLNESRLFNLSRREADIAIRFRRFDQEDLLERRVGDVAYGLYASPDYLRRHGLPDFSRGCESHSITTLHEGAGAVCQVAWLASLAPNARIVLRATGVSGQMMVAESGHALAALPRILADARSTLVRLETPLPQAAQAIRLGVHPDMRDVPRLRAFIDFIVEGFRQRTSQLVPEVPAT